MKRTLLTAILMVIFTGAFAQSGVMDQTFGVGGISTFPFGDNISGSSDPTEHPTAMVQQADGKKIVAGVNEEYNNRLWGWVGRMNTDGSLDSTYSLHGGGFNSKYYLVYQMTLQADQKLLLFGYHIYKDTITYQGDFIIDASLFRFNIDGSLDTSFIINGGNTFAFNRIGPNKGLTNIVVKPNGKILVGVGKDISIGNHDFLLYQFLSNGQLDHSFGNNGVATIKKLFFDNNQYYSFSTNGKSNICQIAVSKDDKIYLGTAMSDSSNTLINCGSIRFLSNGVVDSSYGVNGFAKPNFGLSNFYFGAMSLTPDNKCIVAGHFGEKYNNSKVGLICFDSTGTLKSNFGNGGLALPALPDPSNTPILINIQKDGKIVVAGINELASILGGFTTFLLLRFNRDGSIDSLFGRKGVLSGGESLRDFVIVDSKIQEDGKIVIYGSPFYGGVLARFEDNPRVYYNTFIASSFIDKNRNGIKDANETFFPFGNLLTVKAGTDTISSIFNVDKISLDLDTGTYVSKFIPYSSAYNVVPATHITSNTTYFNTDSVTFAVQPIPGQRDASVQLVPLSTPRPGFQNSYQLAYENKGTDTITNGTIKLIKSNKLIFDSASPAPTSVIGDTLRWNISSLKPLETGNIRLYFIVKTPPTVNIGDTIQSTATITSNKPDLTPANNTSTVKQVVRGSYDPNDKTENHGGKITTLQVANGEYLQYTIRFQNTGNDTAFNVYIRDTLDNKLDWNTMQILTASHSYQMTMNDGNKCLFTLRNINLVDSTNNEPGSHGYIVYKVKPKATVALGDTIKNTAAIYFDYNLPVHTNTETTLIISEVLPLRLLSFTAKKENKTNRLSWTTTNEINVDHFEIERSNNGREFNKIGNTKANSTTQTNSYQYSDAVAPNTPLWGAGGLLYYRIKIVDKDGKFEYSPIRMISNNTDGQISIYPNPARDMVTVTHPSTNIVAQLQITDMNGRILRRATVATSTVQINMNVKGLPAGKYNITWSNGLISHTQALVIE